MADGSFGMGLVRRSSIDPLTKGAALVGAAGLGIILSGPLYLFAPQIMRVLGSPDSTAAFRTSLIILPFSAFGAVSSSLLQRKKNFRKIALSSVSANVCFALSSLLFALFGFGYWSLIFGSVLRGIIENLLLFFSLQHSQAIGLRLPKTSDVIDSSSLFVVTNLLAWSCNNAERIVVSRGFSNEELGIYVRAMALILLLNSLIGAPAFRVLYSSFSSLQAEPDRVSAGFKRSLTLALWASAAVGAGLFSFADWTISLLLGSQWTEAVPILQIGVITLIARVGYSVCEAVPASLGLMRINVVRQIGRLIFVVLFSVIGAETFGLQGVAGGVAAAMWLFFISSLLLDVKLLKLNKLFAVNSLFNVLLIFIAILLEASLARLICERLIGFSTLISIVVFVALVILTLLGLPASAVGGDIRSDWFRYRSVVMVILGKGKFWRRSR